jgi:hypothetical protein
LSRVGRPYMGHIISYIKTIYGPRYWPPDNSPCLGRAASIQKTQIDTI